MRSNHAIERTGWQLWFVTFDEIPPSNPSHALPHQPSLILFSLDGSDRPPCYHSFRRRRCPGWSVARDLRAEDPAEGSHMFHCSSSHSSFWGVRTRLVECPLVVSSLLASCLACPWVGVHRHYRRRLRSCRLAEKAVTFDARWSCHVHHLTMRWSEQRAALRLTFKMARTLSLRATGHPARCRSSCSR
jgi:hypothetical protein